MVPVFEIRFNAAPTTVSTQEAIITQSAEIPEPAIPQSHQSLNGSIAESPFQDRLNARAT
jgi:hypothetical protein